MVLVPAGKIKKNLFNFLLGVSIFLDPLISPTFATEKEDSFDFLNLSTELQLSILEYIPPSKCQDHLSLVSKKMYDLVMHESAHSLLSIDYDTFAKRLIQLTSIHPTITSTQLLKAYLRPAYRQIHFHNFPPSSFSAVLEAIHPLNILKILGLSNGKENTQDIKTLAQILQHPSLEVAFLKFEHFSTDQIQELGNNFKLHPPQLKKLFMDIGDSKSDVKISPILDGLEENQTLTHLQFTKLDFPLYHFEMESVPYLPLEMGALEMGRMVGYLDTHPQLESYILESQLPHAFSPSLLLTALQVIRRHPNLKNVGISLEHLNEESSQELQTILQSKKLKFLELYTNYPLKIDEKKKGWIPVLAPSKLESLNLVGINFTDEVFADLIKSLSLPNRNLKRLQISGSNLTLPQLSDLTPCLLSPSQNIRLLGLPLGLLQLKAEDLLPSLNVLLTKATKLETLNFDYLSFDVKELRSQGMATDLSLFYAELIKQLFSYRQGQAACEWATYAVNHNDLSLADKNLYDIGTWFWVLQDSNSFDIVAAGINFFENVRQRYSDIPEIVESASLNGWLGTYYANNQNYVHAKTFSDIAFKKGRAFEEPLFYKYAAPTYYANQDWQRSAEMYTRYFDTETLSVSSDCYLTAGMAYFLSDDFLRCTWAYHQGLQMPGNHVYFHYRNAGTAHIKLGQFSKAIPYFQKVFQAPDLAHDPLPWYINYINLGSAYFHNHNYQLALTEYEKIIQQEADFPVDVYYSAAQAAISLKNWEKAIFVYEKGIVKEPNCASPTLLVSYVNLGTAYFHTQQWTKAISWFEKALSVRLIPEHIHHRLGYSYAQLWLQDQTQMDYRTHALQYLEELLRNPEKNKIELLGIDPQEFNLTTFELYNKGK